MRDVCSPVMVNLQWEVGCSRVDAHGPVPGEGLIVDDPRAFRQWLAVFGCPTKRAKEYLLGRQQPGQQITLKNKALAHPLSLCDVPNQQRKGYGPRLMVGRWFILGRQRRVERRDHAVGYNMSPTTFVRELDRWYVQVLTVAGRTDPRPGASG